MEIKIQLKDWEVLCICIGHKTRWFEQMHFITCIIECYDTDKNVVGCVWKFGLFSEKEN